MKICSQCKIEKGFECFGLSSYKPAPGKYKAQCKACDNLRTKLHKEKNKEKNSNRDPYDESDKTCSKCNVISVRSEQNFYRDSGSTDGLNCQCKTCFDATTAVYVSKNKEKLKRTWKEYRQNRMSETVKQNKRLASKRRYVENPEYFRKFFDSYKPQKVAYDRNRRNGEKRAQIKAQKAEWLKNNRAWDNAQKAKRKAKKLQATPKWLTNHHWNQIEQIYEKAKSLSRETGQDYQVDHILPLQGETVSGLHVPWNLEPILATENASKKNRLPHPSKWRMVS